MSPTGKEKQLHSDLESCSAPRELKIEAQIEEVVGWISRFENQEPGAGPVDAAGSQHWAMAQNRESQLGPAIRSAD